MTDAAKTAAAKKKAAAQAEVAGEVHTVEIHGLTLTVPAKVPFAAIRYAKSNPEPHEMAAMLEVLLGAEQSARVWAAGLDLDQGLELLHEVMVTSGLTAGESQASATS